MNRLKILIVDDEKYEAVLRENAGLAGVRLEIIGSAIAPARRCARTDGAGLVLCDSHCGHHVVGLELSADEGAAPRRALNHVTGTRFSYAQQAVEIGIEKYILKPVQADELLKTAQKIQKEIDCAAQTGAAPGAAEQTKGELTSTAVAYIESNLSARGLSLKGVASAVYANGSYLSRVFREEAGETVTEYILRRRMEKSRELLGTTDMRAYEVAALVGMPDAHYFGQCFKRFTGMTVNEYRQRMHAGRNREKTE